MDPVYVKKIQDWVKVDNKIIEIETEITPLKETIKNIVETNKIYYDEKAELEKEIIEYIQSNKMDKITINTSDGNIKFAKRTNTQTLSMKVLRSILKAYEDENQDVQSEDIMNFIINNLEKKSTFAIKRNINN